MQSVLQPKQRLVGSKDDIPIDPKVQEAIKQMLQAGYGIDMMADCSIYPENSYAISQAGPPEHQTYVVTYMPSLYTDEAGGIDEKELSMMDGGHDMVEYFDNLDEAITFYLRLSWVYKRQPPPEIEVKSSSVLISADDDDDDKDEAA